MSDKPRKRIYHGIHGSSEDSRIFVVLGGGDPTARSRRHLRAVIEERISDSLAVDARPGLQAAFDLRTRAGREPRLLAVRPFR